MYARRFADGPRFHPASLGAALAINGGVLAALLLARPEIIEVLPKPRLDIFTPAPDPAPPPPKSEPLRHARQTRPGPAPSPTTTPSDQRAETTAGNEGAGPVLDGGGGTGDGGVFREPVLPALVGAVFDPRYADDIEPSYPDALRDAGVEGVVKLRVVIGADGRVKRAEPLAGAAALVRIAVRHVLARWRFHPATRGGVPEESVKVMAVRFRLDG